MNLSGDINSEQIVGNPEAYAGWPIRPSFGRMGLFELLTPYSGIRAVQRPNEPQGRFHRRREIALRPTRVRAQVRPLVSSSEDIA